MTGFWERSHLAPTLLKKAAEATGKDVLRGGRLVYRRGDGGVSTRTFKRKCELLLGRVHVGVLARRLHYCPCSPGDCGG